MQVLVPFRLEEEFKGKTHGHLEFAPDYKVSGNNSGQVAAKLYTDLSTTLQGSKEPDLLHTLTKVDRKKAQSFVKIDFFSTGEHFFFSTVLLLVSGVAYLILTLFIGYFLYMWIPGGQQQFNWEIKDYVMTQYVWFHFIQSLIFVLIWNVFYTYTYPKWMTFLARVILESESARWWYKAFVLKWFGPWGGSKIPVILQDGE